MSLIHTSIIADNYNHLAPVAKGKNNHRQPHVTNVQISSLIDMRALGMTQKECDKHFGRSANCCPGVVFRHGLYAAIEKRIMELSNIH